MKKPYEELDIEVVRFVSEDVITASGAGCEKDVPPLLWDYSLSLRGEIIRITTVRPGRHGLQPAGSFLQAGIPSGFIIGSDDPEKVKI